MIYYYFKKCYVRILLHSILSYVLQKCIHFNAIIVFYHFKPLKMWYDNKITVVTVQKYCKITIIYVYVIIYFVFLLLYSLRLHKYYNTICFRSINELFKCWFIRLVSYRLSIILGQGIWSRLVPTKY